MKKIAMIAVAAMIAGVASADLNVNWLSNAGAIEETSGGNDFLVGVRIDLLYSPAGAITIAGAYDTSALGETLLATGLTGANSLWDEGSDLYVGDFTGGSFFTRVYQSTGAAGEMFIDFEMADGADWVSNPLDPATLYKDPVAPAGVTYLGTNGTTVAIPEPATLGLMGIAGLGMFLARRKARR